MRWLLLGILTFAARGEDLPAGRLIEAVKCAADPSQNYALYLPSNYSPSHQWSVLFALDPGARGKIPIERFQAAAEKYGYIVAGSNNSRNGPMGPSLAAVQAMVADAGARFPIDPKRVYFTGFSGGARIAMQVAVGSGTGVAGVIAASAGFPGGQPRKSVPFVIFGSAGTEDFNYLEMRQLDETVTSPHRVAIFEGSHQWLPAEMAMDAIEWMEVQAMKSGRRARDESFLDAVFARRKQQAESQKDDAEACREFDALIADFSGLRDVAPYAAKAVALRQQKNVRDALKKERAAQQREDRLTSELLELEAGLDNQSLRMTNMAQLKSRLSGLLKQATTGDDAAERQIARRVLRGTFARSRELLKDSDYQKMLADVRSRLS
jgi:dienelactone hydrolase